MWFCTNCCKNELFQKVLKEVRNLLILSNMMIMERICPAIGINPAPLVKDHGSITPVTARKYMRPMKWIYDRPLKTLVNLAHNYPRCAYSGVTREIVTKNTIPTEINYYTLQFGDAVDAKSEETGGVKDKVTRNDAYIVGDKLIMIPPFDTNMVCSKVGQRQ